MGVIIYFTLAFGITLDEHMPFRESVNFLAQLGKALGSELNKVKHVVI